MFIFNAQTLPSLHAFIKFILNLKPKNILTKKNDLFVQLQGVKISIN